MVIDFKFRLTVTRRKVTEVPVNNFVIKSMYKMSADNKITTLYFETKSGVLLNPNDCLAGLNYEDEN